MTPTQSYLVKALLSEINGIKELDKKLEAITEIKTSIAEIEEKALKQQKRIKK